MAKREKEVLEAAMALPLSARSHLAAQLLRSLDKSDKPLSRNQWEQAWATEIAGRIRDIRNGTADLVDGDEALRQVRARLRRRRKK